MFGLSFKNSLKNKLLKMFRKTDYGGRGKNGSERREGGGRYV